jgi:hypothetical protein
LSNKYIDEFSAKDKYFTCHFQKGDSLRTFFEKRGEKRGEYIKYLEKMKRKIRERIGTNKEKKIYKIKREVFYNKIFCYKK